MHYCNKFVGRAWLSKALICCHPASPHPWHPKLIRGQLGTDCGAGPFPELQQEGHWHCPGGSGSPPQGGLVLQLFSFSPNSSTCYSPFVAPLRCLSFFCLPRTSRSKLCHIYHTPSSCSPGEIIAEELLTAPPRRYTTSVVTWSHCSHCPETFHFPCMCSSGSSRLPSWSFHSESK